MGTKAFHKSNSSSKVKHDRLDYFAGFWVNQIKKRNETKQKTIYS